MIEFAPFELRGFLSYMLTGLLFLAISLGITIYTTKKLYPNLGSTGRILLLSACYLIPLMLFGSTLDSWLFCVLGYFFD